MKTAQKRRLTLLVGLLLLSLLVLAIGVPVAQAMLVSGSGAGGGSASVTTSAAPSGTSSTTYWVVGVAAALIAGIGAWALLRRRRQPAESASAAYCARHAEDPMCRVA